MKNKHWPLTFILVLSLQSCYAPQGYYKPDEMPLRGEGAYIRVDNTQGKFIKGELIASNEYGVYVLQHTIARSGNQEYNELKYLPWSDVRAFTLYYAQGKNLNGRVALYSLATISHGLLLILTMPINFLITSTLAQAARNEYSLRSRDLPNVNLWQYARYPQGIPEGITPEEFKASNE